ncbi:MAG: GNAT family N-acetyltransferase [Thermoproteota archaeon]
MEYEGPRGTRKEEFRSVMELVESIFVSARRRGTNMERSFPLLFNQRNLENMRIMLIDGKPVSHIGISEVDALLYGCRIKVGMIGAVCTDPNHRNKGLAGMVLVDCFRKLLLDGIDFVMVSGIRDLYDRNNCVMAGKQYSYKITRKDAERLISFPCKVVKFKESRLDELIAIYQSEPVRYFRSYEEFSTLLGKYTFRRPRVFLIELGGRSVAYICIEIEDHGEDSGWVVEYAGSRVSIASALPKLLDHLNLKCLTLPVPHHDFELIAALSKLRKPKSSHFGGTMRIINPSAFFLKLRPYLESRLGEEASRLKIVGGADKPVIALGDEKLEFKSEKELTWLFFGQPEKVEERFSSYLKPFIIDQDGKLGKILNKVFPLPTFLYGLNYI